MDRTCNTHGAYDVLIKKTLKGRDHYKDLNIDGRIINYIVVTKYDSVV
jgi:hypothetical protein